MKEVNENQPAYKLQNSGFNSLSDAETLSLIIGGDYPLDKSNKLLNEVEHNLKAIASMSITELVKAGLTKREANVLVAAIEIGRRKQLQESASVLQIRSSSDIQTLFSPILEELAYEEFWVLYLNRSNKVLRKVKISQGGISGTVTDVRLIMKKGIELLASGIILCHNHPSGNMSPSEADNKITQKIKEAGNLMDIQVLDHIIIANKEYYSYADNGNI